MINNRTARKIRKSSASLRREQAALKAEKKRFKAKLTEKQEDFSQVLQTMLNIKTEQIPEIET